MTQSRCSGLSVAPQYAQPCQAVLSHSHSASVRSLTTALTRRVRLRAARARRLLVAAIAR